MIFVRCTAFTALLNRVVALEAGGVGGDTYTAGDGITFTAGVDPTEFTIAVASDVARKTLTLAQFAATTSLQLKNLISDETGSGALVFQTNPSLDGPRVINGMQDSAGKKVIDFAQVASAVNWTQFVNSVTGSGPTISPEGTDTNIDLNLDGKGTGGVKYKTFEVGFRLIPTNVQTAAYSTVLADNGKSIDHPASDNNARAFTIDGSVAYPVGTCISFSNMAATAITIPITTDTMYLAGAGTTGTRTLAQYGTATARKVASGVWLISGIGLT